jgi:hypothetical protein
LGAAFSRAKDRYTSGAKSYSPLESEFRRIVVELETAAMEAVYAENERGGEARSVVAEAAGALGVDLNDSFDARWDRDNMARVVPAAAALKKERDDALAARDAWKELAERNDGANGPLRRQLRSALRDLEHLRREYEHVKGHRDVLLQAEELKPARMVLTVGDGEFSTFLPIGDGDALRTEVDELKATVVRQANEITALKGESA